MSHTAVMSALESLLFISGEPLSLARLGKILQVSKAELTTVIDQLTKKYRDDSGSGLLLIQDEKSILLATKPSNLLFVEALTKSTLQENMSKAALEVLSIIAYRAPIARVDIDAIRGVNCSFTLRNLLLRDLISREGNPGDSRGYLYRPSLKFLQVLGLENIARLPDYQVLSEDERLRLILEEDMIKETKTE
ncbi:MAG: SMC-Scp complex subunit ScpB [Candidatus Moranbacteria bacterium]|nr:SMC-Scp complex subunit ScpB [Candidatus Moranbacteria bacterium]